MPGSRPLVELAYVETADGLFLDGALQRPQSDGPLPVDALLLIHGTGSNFYASGVLETFAQRAVAQGAAVLRVNTRGHDGMCSIPCRTGSVKGGATYERISDCLLDVTAWVNWLAIVGCARIVLVGHSMGAVKAIYAEAHAPHRAVCGIVGISPPRFAYDRLRTGPRGETFCEEFARASEMIAAGHGETLLAVTQPIPLVVTAAGYVEKYGPENRYDYVPLLSGLSLPTLLLIGGESVKTSAAFSGLPQAIAEDAANHSQLTCEIVEGADINYKGCEMVPFVRTTAWLSSFGGGGVAAR